jgi:hypothetical protein
MNHPQQVPEGKNVRLKITGPVDENFQFPEQVACEAVIVDFDGMTVFNSVGIQTWLKWSRDKRGFQSMKLENCRSPFLNQMRFVNAMVPEFASVDSFYVPFYDAAKDSTTEAKLVRGKDYDETKLELPKPTNAQGEPLELDVDPSYFHFLKKK